MSTVRERARRRWRRLRRPARIGLLRRTDPVSVDWGFDRGTPVDRFYIARFLHAHRADIRGRVLEVKNDALTRRHGIGVVSADVLDIDPTNALATVHADLAAADHVPSASFDCFILTQTLQLIFDTAAVVRHAHRMLAPGGTLLVTVPSLSRLAGPPGAYPDYWRFTAAACERLFGDVFGAANVEVRSEGNVLAGIGFLTGLAAEELGAARLDRPDPRVPVLITVRAVKDHGAVR